VDIAAWPNGNKPRRDVHGVTPEIEAELAPADYPSNHGPNMQATSEFPTGWSDAGRLDHFKGAGEPSHDRVQMWEQKIASS
jgi:hypothetical protein